MDKERMPWVYVAMSRRYCWFSFFRLFPQGSLENVRRHGSLMMKWKDEKNKKTRRHFLCFHWLKFALSCTLHATKNFRSSTLTLASHLQEI
jgi:hypothetical protein